mgnify:CR=1 FL=1
MAVTGLDLVGLEAQGARLAPSILSIKPSYPFCGLGMLMVLWFKLAALALNEETLELPKMISCQRPVVTCSADF